MSESAFAMEKLSAYLPFESAELGTEPYIFSSELISLLPVAFL